MRHVLAQALACTTLLLASCGGGDSSPPPATGGTPTPTPSPTPTPTPSPTPSYTAFSDIAVDTDFDTSCFGHDGRQTPAWVLDDPSFGNGLSISYAASARKYSISGETFTFEVGPDEKDPSSTDPIFYYGEAGATSVTFGLGAFGARYGRLATVIGTTSPTLLFECTLGVRTQDDDLPRTDTAYAALRIGGTVLLNGDTYSITDSVAHLTYRQSDDTIALSIDLAGTKTDATTDTNVYSLGTLETSAPVAIDGTAFAGAISSRTPETFSGSFGGSFYGPGGREAGLIFQIKGTTSTGGAYSARGGLLATMDN